jgi:hypothetical protein
MTARMTLEEFQQTLGQKGPPVGMPPLLQALWWEGRGEWARSHEIAQDENGADAAWVHAYLHRKEGDAENAGYWYRQAGRTVSKAQLEHEWREMVTELLARL